MIDRTSSPSVLTNSKCGQKITVKWLAKWILFYIRAFFSFPNFFLLSTTEDYLPHHQRRTANAQVIKKASACFIPKRLVGKIFGWIFERNSIYYNQWQADPVVILFRDGRSWNRSVLKWLHWSSGVRWTVLRVIFVKLSTTFDVGNISPSFLRTPNF